MVWINPLKLQSSIGSFIWDKILIQSGSTPSFSAMARKLSSPTFNTHLANFRCSSKLAATTRMLIRTRRIITCCQRCDRGNEALTMSFSSSLGNNRQDLSKIPTKDHGFPTKDLLSYLWIIQFHQITQGLINRFKNSVMQHRCLIPNDQISLTHQLDHSHLLCDVTSQFIMQINQNLESWMGNSVAQK